MHLIVLHLVSFLHHQSIKRFGHKTQLRQRKSEMSKLVCLSHLAELAYYVLQNFLTCGLIGVCLVNYGYNVGPFREQAVLVQRKRAILHLSAIFLNSIQEQKSKRWADLLEMKE